MGFKTWRYHPEEGARLFDSDEIPVGWFDTPAAFDQKTDDISDLSKKDLEVYAKKHFGVDLDRRLSKDKMLNKIVELEGTG